MLKVYLKKLFSSVGALHIIEKVNFQRQKFINAKKNQQFLIKNPSIKMPPDYFMYETFALDYNKIYFGGLETANWIINHLKKHITFSNKSILDWGSGSGRVLRHIPNIIDDSNTVFGTDYNKEYTKWSKQNIKNVTIKKNDLNPPLQFKDNFFNAIYGISIFTHLSEKMHHQWFKELHRVLKKDGVILLTTHGECFKGKLTKKEQKKFDSGKLIEHSYKKEGNRLYASYQNPIFIKELCKSNGFNILEHIEEGLRNNKPQQDVWILQKK